MRPWAAHQLVNMTPDEFMSDPDIERIVEVGSPSDEITRRAIQRVLEKAGYSVTMVADAEGALELVSDIDFDLIISDLRMPGKTGIELLSEVKHQKPETQFLIVSAYGDEDTEALAKRMGASEVLSKPFRRQKLIDCTVRVLG